MHSMRFWAALAVLTFAIGCAQTEDSSGGVAAVEPPAPAPVEETPSLVGSWVMDLDAMKQSPGFTEATPEQRQQMLAMLSMMQVSFEFTEDTITSKMGFAGQVDETKDSYRIIDVSGSTFKIESTDASGTVSVIDARLDGDRLELTDPKAGSFQLKRP